MNFFLVIIILIGFLKLIGLCYQGDRPPTVTQRRIEAASWVLLIIAAGYHLIIH